MREPVTAYVGLGANLGDAVAAIKRSLQDLDRLPYSRLAAQSSLYRSAPVDATGPDFINAVAALETCLTGPELLSALQAIEQHAGRKRPFPNAPRTLDLDLLLFGSGYIDSPQLTVPHPRMNTRAFVLLPLAEIAPASVTSQQLAAIASQVIARMTP